jgi:hypothetical protein
MDEGKLERPFPEQTGTASRTAQVDSPFSIGSVLLNRFRILRLAGCGGMGEVYEAEDLESRTRTSFVSLICLRFSRNTTKTRPEWLLSSRWSSYPA